MSSIRQVRGSNPRDAKLFNRFKLRLTHFLWEIAAFGRVTPRTFRLASVRLLDSSDR